MAKPADIVSKKKKKKKSQTVCVMNSIIDNSVNDSFRNFLAFSYYQHGILRTVFIKEK